MTHGDETPPATGAGVAASALFDLARALDRVRGQYAGELGIGSTDLVAMLAIGHRPDQRPGDLARTLALGMAGTSSVVDKLVKAGFVRRDPHPTDRRSVLLALTPGGQHAYAWVVEQTGLRVHNALDERDVAALRRASEVLVDGADAPHGTMEA